MPEEDTGSNRGGPKPVIRASELGTYSYCHRAWWLKRVAGFDTNGRSARMEAGIDAHGQHARRLQRSLWQRRLALRLLLAGSLLLAVALAAGLIPR